MGKQSPITIPSFSLFFFFPECYVSQPLVSSGYISAWLLQPCSQVTISSADVNKIQEDTDRLKSYNACKTELYIQLVFRFLNSF